MKREKGGWGKLNEFPYGHTPISPILVLIKKIFKKLRKSNLM